MPPWLQSGSIPTLPPRVVKLQGSGSYPVQAPLTIPELQRVLSVHGFDEVTFRADELPI